MARRRQLSTDISVDKAVNRLAREYGDFAVMLYTWMIPHAEEDATLTGDPEEILYSVIPGRRDKSEQDVIDALMGMAECSLIEWDRINGIVGFPPVSFYKYQSQVKEDRRRTGSIFDFGSETGQRQSAPNRAEPRQTAPSSAEPQITAGNAASFSSSVSFSSPVAVARETETFADDLVPVENETPTATADELSAVERRIVSRIKGVRGMACVPDLDIALHLRDVLSDRSPPIPNDILLAEAARFREYHSATRSNQPVDKPWPSRGWKRALTYWFTKTRYEPVSATAERPRPELREWTIDDDPFETN